MLTKLYNLYLKFWRVFLPTLLIVAVTAGYFLFLDKDTALQAKADYLRFTETTDYYHLQSNTYGIRVSKNSSDNYMRFTDGDGVEVGVDAHGPTLYSGGTYYYARNDTNRVVSVIENTKSRTVIKVTGKFDDTYGSGESFLTDGADDVTYIAYYFVYSEYFNNKIIIDAGDGIDLERGYLIKIEQSNYYFDSGERYYGTTTSESLASNYGIYEADYGAVLATSTPDWQITSVYDQHSGTTSLAFYLTTEPTWQNLYAIYNEGTLLGENTAVFNVRPAIGTTAESRRAWAAQVLAMDEPAVLSGAAVTDLSGETYQSYTSDGSYNISAVNNKAKLTLHGENDAHALLTATTTGGDSTLTFNNDSGLADPGATTTNYAQLGNRRPYGSFDINDPDVLFYWDMNSTSTNQAPNKGVGPIEVEGNNFQSLSGVAGNSVYSNGNWSRLIIDNNNFNSHKGSFAFWYRNASTTTYSSQPIIYHGDNNAESQELRLIIEHDTNTVIATFNYIQVINNNLDDYVDLGDMNWHFIRVNYDSEIDITELFVDGSLVHESTIAFPSLELYKPVRVMFSDGNVRLYHLDEFYISSDPNQPDAPSYFDVFSYTDKSGSTLTGIPEYGDYSIKWNHPPMSPIVQTTKQSPKFTLHDFSPKTRSTSTGALVDHLVLDLPLDGEGKNENVGKVWDKVSESWIGTTSAGVTFEQGVQGNAFTTPEGSAGAVNDTLLLDEAENYIGSKGTIEFSYKYAGFSDYYGRFFSGAANNFELRKNGASELIYAINGDEVNFTPTIDIEDGQWHHFKVIWNDDDNFRKVYIDNSLELSTTTSFTIPDDHQLYGLGIGCEYLGTYYLDGQIDNFRIYNDVLLPYGAYYTGEPNEGHYGQAHPDITFYWNMEDVDQDDYYSSSTPSINNATTTTGIYGQGLLIDSDSNNEDGRFSADGIVQSQGSLGFWYKNNGTKEDYSRFFDCNNTDFRFRRQTSDTSLDFTIGADINNLSIPSGIDIWDGNWHFMQIKWADNTDLRELWVDGQLGESDNTAFTFPDLSGVTCYIGNESSHSSKANGIIDEFYITNDPYSPDIPTAFGKPLLVPQVAVTDAGTDLKQIETDYDVSLADSFTSWLVSYHHDVSDATTFYIADTFSQQGTSYASSDNIETPAPLLHASYTSGYSTITVQRGDGSYADDFKLIFSETDAGVSSCYLGQGSTESWGDNLCSATSLLSEVEQNSQAQDSQTGVLSLLQDNSTEVIVRNYFTLGSEATTTEDWHIFSDGSIVIDRTYEKGAANSETRTIDPDFPNYTYHPTTPDVTRTTGTYHDSLFIHPTETNTAVQDDYTSPGYPEASIGSVNSGYGTDIDKDSFAESRGAYAFNANSMGDPGIPSNCGDNPCGQPIYHTIGTTTATVNVTVSAVDNISTGLWIVQFSGTPDLSGIHKRDKFTDSGTDDWNIISVDDANDQIIVGDQEQNGGTPTTGAGTVGPWYTSLSSWESAEDRDLTSTSRYTNGEIEMAECWPTKDEISSPVYILDWTTAENNYIKIYTPTEARHKGVWSDDYYNIVGEDVIVMANYEDYIRLDGLQITSQNPSAVGRTPFQLSTLTSGDNKIYINDSIFKGHNSSSYWQWGVAMSANTNANVYISNSLFYNFSNENALNLDVVYSYGDSIYVYNTTVVGGENAVRCVTGDCVVQNVIVQDSLSGFNGTFTDDSDYNISNVTSNAPGDNSKTCTVSFVSTSTGDFHLASDDTCARDSGAHIPLSRGVPGGWGVSFDIDGTARPTSHFWDIGADEYRDRYSNNLKITLDPSTGSGQVFKPRFVINDYYPLSGKKGSEEDFMILHLPLEGTSTDSVVYDKISGTNIATATDDVAFKPAYNGYGAYFGGGSNTIAISNSRLPNEWYKKGSIAFTLIPDETVLSSDNYMFYFDNNPQFTVALYEGNVAYFLYGGVMVGSGQQFQLVAGQPSHFHFAYDDAKNFAAIIQNGQVLGVDYQERSQSEVIDEIRIGGDGTQGAEGIIDDFRIYSEPILPYGAYYTGYEQNGTYAYADPSLMFYWDMESETVRMNNDLGQKTVTLNSDASITSDESLSGEKSVKFRTGYSATSYVFDNSVNLEKGCIGTWVYSESYLDNTMLLGLELDSNNYILIRNINGDGSLQGIYNHGGSLDYNTVDSSLDLVGGAWHWLKLCWDNERLVHWVERDGLKDAENSFSEAWSISNQPVLKVGNDSGTGLSIYRYFDQMFVVNNPYSDEIPTAFGKPINMPQMYVDDTRQNYGYDYVASWTADMNSVVIQYMKDVTSSQVIEVGDFYGSAQPVRLRGGVRLEGGVRF